MTTPTGQSAAPRSRLEFCPAAVGHDVLGVLQLQPGAALDVTTGDFPLNATAPRMVLSNGRSVADPFFNPAYPRARRRGVDMLAADDAHLVNLRMQKTFTLPAR